MNETTHSSLPSSSPSRSTTTYSPSEERAPLPPVHPSSTPPQSQELLSSPETPLPPTTPKTPNPSGSRTTANNSNSKLQLLRTSEGSMVNDSTSSRGDDVGLGYGDVGANGFGGRVGGGGGGKEGAEGHPSVVQGTNQPPSSSSSSSSRAQSSTSASTSSHPQAHHRSSSKGNVVPPPTTSTASSSSSSTFLPPPPPPQPSSTSSSTFKRPIPATSSHSKPHPPSSTSSTTFTIRPTPVPLASSADDVPMRSPSPSPQRPETSNSLVPSSSIAGSDDEDAVGEPDEEDELDEEQDEEDEPAGVPTEEEIEKLQEKVDQLSLEFGLGEEEEVGDDESREMKGLREMRDLISPLLPALHMIPTLYSQVQSQSETIVSLRKVLTIQAELAQRAAEENRSIQEVERAGWESSLNVLLDKARDAHGKEMAIQQEKITQAKQPKTWSAGPSQSKKETGFAKIEAVDNEDYDKLIKKWLELQAENRKAGVEKTTMMYKIRDSETQINALTEELHFLRASALHGSRSAPVPLPPSARNYRIPAPPIYGSADDLPLPPSARRQTLGDARAEHLLLAAKRLRTLRVTNPEIGLIKTGDYGLAGMDVPEDVRNLGGQWSRGGVASSSMMALGSSGIESSGLDGDMDDEMGSGTVGGRTPKAKAAAAARGKGKKSLAATTSGHHLISSSSAAAALPIPRTPTAASKGKSPSKKKGGAGSGPTQSVEMTPGGTAIPGASFDDLLMAAGVFSRPTTTMGVSAARGSANADDGEEEIDEIDSDEGSSTLIESPKRRRVEGGAASSWVPGQILTSGDLNRQQQQPIAGPSNTSSSSQIGQPPRNPLNSSTGSEGTMHATALDLLALASFGSQDPSSSSVHNPSSQASASSSSSSRLGGVMASSQPHSAHPSSSQTGLVSLEPAFVLRSSPDPQQHPPPHNIIQSPFYAPAQHTPHRPNQYHHHQDDPFSPSTNTTPGSSVPSRVKDFAAVDGAGGEGGGGLFGSPAGGGAGGKFVNLSAANIPGGTGAGAGAGAGGNMPARRVRSPYLKWSNEEDELLARGVAKYGQKWDLVSKAVPTRSYHQCRQRWLRKLGVFDHKPAIATSTSNSATIFGGHADQES
ncbi:hypothetical protein BDY24DRAFT_398282 [Mrakia frigida]|uniref:SANT/Myb-like DNA-binding domain-containing protein n=1 Tax=Mrakia frigida TaxID=29902 RepID=UPI003FCBF2AD